VRFVCFVVRTRETQTEWRFNPRILAERNQHGVPQSAIERMLARWEYDFTVEDILQSQPPPHGRASLRLAQELIRERPRLQSLVSATDKLSVSSETS
jgi:hypothetical protein